MKPKFSSSLLCYGVSEGGEFDRKEWEFGLEKE